MDVARSAAREVLSSMRRRRALRAFAGNMDAVAAREMMDVSLSALRLGRRKSTWCALKTALRCLRAEEIEEAEEEGIIIHAGLGRRRS